MHFRKRVTAQSSLDGSSESESSKREFGRQDERLKHSLDRIALKRALDALPFGYRTIFELHEFDGYGHREIAKILHCTVGNSKSQLHKAKQRIRECLVSRRHLARRMRETMNHSRRAEISAHRTFQSKESSSQPRHRSIPRGGNELVPTSANFVLGSSIQSLAETAV
jgi:hypothetical protein